MRCPQYLRITMKVMDKVMMTSIKSSSKSLLNLRSIKLVLLHDDYML